MGFRGDRRSVTVQVGAVLLFGMLVVSMSVYQATVVPADNERVEFNHNQRVQGQLYDVRNGILGTAATGTGQPASVALGTEFPSRTLFVNPPPPGGSLRTSGLGSVTVANATATGEAGDFWNGTAHTYETKGLAYDPSYSEYRNAPTTGYEHTVLYNRFPSGANLTLTEQRLVDGRRINLVALGGNLSRSQTGTVTVHPRPVSAPSRTIAVTNGTGPLRLTLPTTLPESVWRDLLRSELDRNVSETRIDSSFETEDGSLPPDWQGDPDTELVSDETVSNSGTHAVRFGGNNTGAIDATLRTSGNLDTIGYDSVTVGFWAYEDGANANDASEDLVVEYRAENGSWVAARTLLASDDPASTTYDETVEITDEAAFHDEFAIRFRLPRVDNMNDNWYVDDVNVTVSTQQGHPDRYVTDLRYNSTTTPNTLRLTFERGATYNLQMARVGVGTASDESDPTAAYVVPIAGNESRIPARGERRLVVEARDRYNNPVGGVTVEATGVPTERLSPTQTTTDEHGRAVFVYTAPDPISEEAVRVSIADNSSAVERTTFVVNPENPPQFRALFADDFDRPDSDTVDNGWVERENTDAGVRVAGDRLSFAPNDDVYRPVVNHTFAERSSGTIKWTDTFNMERTGSESNYRVRMQLGDEATMRDPATDPDSGTAVDLAWGGPNDGFTDHEGFGYQTASGMTQIAVVSGDDGTNAGGNVTVTVTADLDTNTYNVSVDGPGRISGSGEASGVQFRTDADIDTIRIFMNGVNRDYFGDLEVDDVEIRHAE